jgi:Na+-driven multidrug efflux pump
VAGEVVWSINMMFNSKILGGYGETVITAASVANTLNTLAFITISGLASAVGIITGKTVGAGKTELMKEYARTTQILFLGVGLFSGALLALIGRPFVGLYGGISDEAARQSLNFARVLAVTIIGTGYQMPCLFGLVKSGGDISFVFRNDTLFVFLVVLPSAALAAYLGAPAWVTFACLKCDQILKCFVAVVKVNRYNWMKKLTREA